MADSTPVQTWYDLLNIMCSHDVNMTEFKRLLDTRKADLNRRDNSGRTLLDYCALSVNSYQPFDESILSKYSRITFELIMFCFLLQANQIIVLIYYYNMELILMSLTNKGGVLFINVL